MISAQAQTPSQLYPPSALPSTFEFTKRKRWADLLITELTEAIILILSTRCQILYCSAAIRELLGWRDEDLIDTEFLDLVNGTWIYPVLSFTLLLFTTGSSPQLMTARALRKTLNNPSGITPICNRTLGCKQSLKLHGHPPTLASLKLCHGQRRCCSKSMDIHTL